MHDPNTLVDLLGRSASQYGDRTALVLGDARTSYTELDEESNRVANLLISRNIQPGDKVALSCPTMPEFTTIYFGVLKAGAVVVPLNILLRPREIAYHLGDSDAVAYFAFEGTPELPIGANSAEGFARVDACRELFVISSSTTRAIPLGEDYAQAVQVHPSTPPDVEVNPDDSAVILYTSGTTGQPKGAELRHRNMVHNALLGTVQCDADAARPDTFLCVLPLFHSFGQTVLQNTAIAFAGTLVLVSRFEPKVVLDVMRRERVTVFGGVPTMYWALLGAAAEDPNIDDVAEHVRAAFSGGAALPHEIHQQFERVFGVTIMEGYGLSETSPTTASARWGEPARVGSIGVPVPDVSMKLIDDDWSDVPEGDMGEIAISGPNVMKGYYGRPEATAEAIRDGWFRTGDLARKDEDGNYYIIDRTKDMIIRGGFNVYPREIEEVMITHPAVSLVAVIGVPDDRLGEEIKAIVVPAPGATTTSEDLVAWTKEQVAAYKYPRIVEFRDTLPMTSTGKILKRELA